MTQEPRLSHIDDDGKAVMVDVSSKDVTSRVATAGGTVFMEPETMQLVQEGGMKKGDVLSVARLAGIMGAKKTTDFLEKATWTLAVALISSELSDTELEVIAECRVSGKTGVEMEALTAVSVAALTIYDMCKAVDRTMRLTDIRLLAKSGGQSGDFRAKEQST